VRSHNSEKFLESFYFQYHRASIAEFPDWYDSDSVLVGL
jgi:hypothetical protein